MKIPKSLIVYGFSVFVSVLAGLLTWQLTPYIGDNPSILFQAAVVLGAYYGAVGGGLTAALTSFLIFDYYFLHPLNAFTGHKNLMSLFIFAAVAALTGSLSGRLKKAKSDIEAAHDDLEERLRERTAELLDTTNREQRRLGQDLHDGLCQILAGVKLVAENLNTRLTDQSHPDTRDAAIIESRLKEALTQADAISRGLCPVELEDERLVSALQDLAQKTSQAFSIDCRLDPLGWDPDLSRSATVHIYRIAQEAVTNAHKNGKAKNINLRLSREKDQIRLDVADDGVGFPSNPTRKGMGLKIMEYRARVLGGFLSIHAKPGGGTIVSCRFPDHIKEELPYGR